MDMDRSFLRNGRLAIAFLGFLLIEPTRCGVPPIQAQIAQFPPAIVITEGVKTQGHPYLFGGVSSD